MDALKSINARIVEVRKQEELTQEGFGLRLGVTRSVIKNIECGATAPNSLFLNAVATEFEVDRHWLETGEGEMYAQPTDIEEKIGDLIGSILRPDTDERKKELVFSIVKAIYQLPDMFLPEIQKFAQSVAESASEKQKEKDED